MKKIVLAVITALFLQSCTYAISPEVADKSDKTLTFEQLQADPETFKGKLVILGGTIAQINNSRQGTIIEVTQKELDYWGKPRRTNKTGGQFLIVSPGYLDAMVYAPGREITIAAEVAGKRGKALGEIAYTYPVLDAREIKLWEREQVYRQQPQWFDPLYDPNAPLQQ